MKKMIIFMLIIFLKIIPAQSNNLDNFPPMTLWAVEDEPATLYYFVLSEDDDLKHKEGKITVSNPGDDDKKLEVEALAIDTDGTIYFINDKKKSVLYKIAPSDIDGDKNTDVKAEFIGNSGLRGNDRITCLTVIDGVLYGISKSRKKLYSIDKTDGSVTKIRTLNLNGYFKIEGMTVAPDGTVYFVKTRKPSELWKFDSFPNGSLSKVMKIEKSGKIQALAAHPNGFIYAADDENWFKIDPANKKADKIAEIESDIEGMDFYSGGESSGDDDENEADLSLTQTVDKDKPENGDAVKFSLKLQNDGPYNATNVKISETLPDGLDFVSSSPSTGTVSERDGKYIWEVPELLKNSSATLDINTKVNVTNANNSNFDLGVASDYNVFVLHDIHHSSDIEGKVAVGHDAQFDSAYSIGYPLHADAPQGDVLIVDQDLEVHSGAIYGGDVAYGHDTSNVGSFNWELDIVDGTLKKERVLDFSKAKNDMHSLSEQLAKYSANMETDFTFTKLTLAGTSPFINVFDVTKDQLNNATEVLISAPNGSVVLVNIAGDSLKWIGGLFVTGTELTNVLYNFYEAKDIEIQKIDVRGSILAPEAHVNFISGVQNGQMIAYDLEGGAQFNDVKFVGNVPSDTVLVSVAEIISSDQSDPDSSPNNGDESEDDMANVSVNISPNDPSNIGGTGSAGNWELVSSFAQGEIVWVMTYDNDGNLISGTWGGNVYKSTDSGLNWSLLNSDMTARFIWSIAVNANGVMFAGTEAGVFKSDADGLNWTSAGLSDYDVRSVVIHNGVIYAATWGSGIFTSSDNGDNWTSVNDNFIGLNIHSLMFDSKGNMIIATFDDGIYKSSDNGSTFHAASVDYPHIWTLGITSGDLMFAGTYGNGIYTSSDNGENWNKEFAVTSQYIYSISVDGSDNVYASSWNRGVYALSVGGLQKTNGSWIDMGLDGFGVSSLLTQPNSLTVYAGTSDGNIYKDADGLTGLNELNKPVDEFKVFNNYPNPFNPSTKIKFMLPNASSVKIEIFNVLGEKIAEPLPLTNMSGGLHEVSFNASGLASGAYLYKLSARTADGKNFIKTNKMVLLK